MGHITGKLLLGHDAPDSRAAAGQRLRAADESSERHLRLVFYTGQADPAALPTTTYSVFTVSTRELTDRSSAYARAQKGVTLIFTKQALILQ
jgi:hypothetical protein